MGLAKEFLENNHPVFCAYENIISPAPYGDFCPL